MRTTLTLDDDVAVLLERVRKARKTTLKEVVNVALREGLVEMTKPATAHKARPQMRTFDLGPPGMNLDNIGEVLAAIEGEDYK